MKISKRVREQAAECAAVIASSEWTTRLSDMLDEAYSIRESKLAAAAWRVARKRLQTLPGSRVAWAEAEAMLRSWTLSPNGVTCAKCAKRLADAESEAAP